MYNHILPIMMVIEYKMYKKALHVDILQNLACYALRNSLSLQIKNSQYEILLITFQQPHMTQQNPYINHGK